MKNRNPLAAVIIFLTSVLTSPWSFGYTLPDIPTFEPGADRPPLDAVWTMESGRITLHTIQAWGGDAMSMMGGGCTQGDLSCIRIMRNIGGKHSDYRKEVRACLPKKGAGSLAEAATALARKHLLGDIPLENQGTGAGQTYVGLQIAQCQNPSMQLIWEAQSGGNLPILCRMTAPPVIDLGTTRTDIEQDVGATVSCSGEPGIQTTARVSIEGSSSIQVAKGVQIWTKVLDKSFAVGSDSVQIPVRITAGVRVQDGQPGPYHASFVYVLTLQ